MTNSGANWSWGDEMVKLIIGVAGAVALIVVLVAAIGLVTGRFLGADTMTAAELKQQNEQLSAALAVAKEEITDLKEVNARLQADIASGRTVEEERRALETRSKELDRREQNVTASEQLLIEREAKLQQAEKEFYEATNLTQQEIGQAMQIETEYEAMRQSRDDAQKLANQWLMFIWAVSIGAFVLLLVLVILIMRYWSVISRYRAESEQRRQIVTLISATLTTAMTDHDKASLVSALSSIAGLPQNTPKGQIESKSQGSA